MRIGSLFSGIGGLELGIERALVEAGLPAVVGWQVEADPFCRTILAKHWPHATRFADVRGFTPPTTVDLICGGFPCQDISNAGTRKGIAGERSGLWFEFARIIAESRPRFVVIENVAALLRRGLGVVLGDLAACGYDATWDCIPAASVGAPHRRDRLFVVAYRNSGRCEVERIPDWKPRHSGPCGDLTDRRSGEAGEMESTANTDSDGGRQGPISAATGGSIRDIDSAWPPGPNDVQAWRRLPVESQPAFCRITYGIPRRLDRLRALGNAVVPAVAMVAGRMVVDLALVGAGGRAHT